MALSTGGEPAQKAASALPQALGVPPVLAAMIVAEIGDITRFSRAEKLAILAGLTPRHRESGLKVTRSHHQAGLTGPAVGFDRSAPAATRRLPPFARSATTSWPALASGPQHCQGRRRPPPRRPGPLRHVRRPHPSPRPTLHHAATGRSSMECSSRKPAQGRPQVSSPLAPGRASNTACPSTHTRPESD
ncbi:transposase [Spirillospora sp. NPDC047418]